MDDHYDEDGSALVGCGCLLACLAIIAALAGVAFILWAIGFRILGGGAS